MSKVAICSIIIGKVNVTTKAGDTETISFEDKGGIGYAEVTHEQAEQFLKIKGEYWKPGQRNIVDAVQTALNADSEAAAAAAKLLGGEGEGTEGAVKTVAQMVELIKLAATAAEVDTLVGEDTRSGVITAATKRKAQLEKQ